MTLPDLIDRLQKAEGPDKTLDALIMQACEPETGKFGWSAFPYTASIDAAIAFTRRVLKGVVLRRVADDDGMAIKVEIVWLPNGLGNEPEIKADAWHQHEAIALVIAVLRSLAEHEEAGR